MLVKLIKSKNNPEKNRIQVNLITSGLRYLNEEIKNMSEEKEVENPYGIVDIVKNILEFNRQQQQQQQQQGQGLKALTPNQMLSRLPIALAQLKAGNNSEKLKNETRQIL